MVAPGYSASTAASTWVFVSPVSSCSSERCGCDGSTVDPLVELPAVVSPAALALSVPARIPPATTPAATSPAPPAHRCQRFLLLIDRFLSFAASSRTVAEDGADRGWVTEQRTLCRPCDSGAQIPADPDRQDHPCG